MSHWRFLLHRLSETLWVRAALYAAFGVAMALVAALFDQFVPKQLAEPFGGGTVDGLLNILAASLLAVATFSVSALLSAFTNVTSNATPRAAVLVAGNRPAQDALATFVGAFLYAVVGYSALGTGYYAKGGRAILFFVTLVMLAIVAVTLLRWLDHLLRLAKVEHAISAVEAAAAEAIGSVFGAGAPLAVDPVPESAATVVAGRVGYVQNVDIEALRALARAHELTIWVQAPPGCLTLSDTALAAIDGAADPATCRAVRETFTLDVDRSFKQDPQYGFIVLGEIAAKALSPAVNNPGVAKDVLTSVVRLLERWMDERQDAPEMGTGPVHWCGPTLRSLIEDALLPVAAHGAGTITVAIRLQDLLSALFRSAGARDRPVLLEFAMETLRRSEAELAHETDRDRVRRAAHVLTGVADRQREMRS